MGGGVGCQEPARRQTDQDQEDFSYLTSDAVAVIKVQRIAAE